MKIDAHQHFWDYEANPGDFTWMGPAEEPIRRNFLHADLEPLLDATGYDATVAVQARELKAETDFLLDLAAANPRIKGVVGWLDLCAADVERDLEVYRGRPLLKGFRMLVHDHPDVGFAASEAHVRGVGRLERHGFTYDLLLKPPHLKAAIALVDRLPNQMFVVDHIAKPAIDGHFTAEWRAGIEAIARRPNVWCKLSGLVTLPGAVPARRADFHPYLDIVLEAFGAGRCMIGSDWPVATCGADYAGTMAIVEGWSERLSASERAAVLGGNCAAFYGLS